VERVARTAIAEQTDIGAGGISLCAVQSKNYVAVRSHFARGPERDPDKTTQLAERTEG